ncbi:MAG: type II toxin-antitoxin system HicA family toxin [Deltaproteobacteria bacterium]|nr:type II toxin-antitoxin system HicA family toxin [Deltaproteobacteria bacterium]
MSSELYRWLTAILKDGGCYFPRQGKGSHEICFSPITNRAFSIPSNIKPLPLAKAILKSAGLND